MMKKLFFTTFISSTALLGFTLAQADVNNNTTPMHKTSLMQQKAAQQHGKKDLNLTSSEAQTLVLANIIKHGNAGKKMIQKTEVIKLDNDKTFYIIYIGSSQQTATSYFFIVNAQNAQVMPFPHPKPKHLKNREAPFSMKGMPMPAPIAPSHQPT